MMFQFSNVVDMHKNSIPGPDDITRVQLPNHIVVLSRANFNSPSIYISGLLQVGALFDPIDKLGLSDFTASALMRGTHLHNFQEIYEALESTGASLGLGGGTHTTRFSGKALVEDLDMLLGLLAEVLRYPVFPLDQVERLRAQWLASLAIRSQDTGDMAAEAFDQVVYKNHPYRHPDEGYPETIQTIQQSELVEFHRMHFGPRGMLIAIVGGVDPSQAVEKASKAFLDWQNPVQPNPPELPELSPLDETTSKTVAIPGKIQSDIVMGAAGPPRTSPDFLAASLGNNVLGQFGMMGRVGEAVREKAGLAYFAVSSLGGGPGPGSWDIHAGVDPDNLEQVAGLIKEEIRRFVREPVTKEELLDSQSSFVGRLPLSLESNEGVASALITLERYQLGLDYYWRYPGLVDRITEEEIMETARHYLDPDRLGIGIAGP